MYTATWYLGLFITKMYTKYRKENEQIIIQTLKQIAEHSEGANVRQG